MKELLKLLGKRQMLVILFMGFSSGIPLALVGSTLQAWMTTQKVDLTLIGIFSLVGLPYTLKFLWAPFLDQYIPPFLGRRRGWMLISQIALFFALSGMAFCDPVGAPSFLGASAFCVAFFGASQDIVVDAYKTEILEAREFGSGAAVANLGYRMAMLFSGAFALILADHLPWRTIYLLMASIFIVSAAVSLWAPEPKSKRKTLKTFPSRQFKPAMIQPFEELLSRKGIFWVLSFVIIYKLDVVIALAMMTPFLMELGFTKTDIGAVTKGFGLIATLSGTLCGGIWLTRIGIYRSLWVFGILQGISGFCFYALSMIGHSFPMMVITIAAENFFSGMGNAAYAAFLMSLCNPRFTATQFALLTSLMALTRVMAGTPTGWLAKSVGWPTYYLIAMVLAIPGLLLLLRLKDWIQVNLNEAKSVS